VAEIMFKEFAITIKGVPNEGVARRFWKEIESDYYRFMRLHAYAVIYGEAPSETIDWLVIKCRKFGFDVIEVAR
jgi:hypothetical protein